MQDSWRRAMAALGAVAIVAGVALATSAVLGALDDDDTGQTVGIGEVGGDRTTTTTDRKSSTRRSTTTTTTTTTTTAEPEVLAETTERDPQAPPARTAPARPTPAAPRPSPAPAASPSPSPGPPPVPPPAPPPALICRNSIDPACGPLVWDPAPGPYDVEVEEISVPLEIVVGEEVTFAVDYTELAGADAVGACASWTISKVPDDEPVDGEPQLPSSPCDAENHSCSRYGPHHPPAASDDEVRVENPVTFTTPGTYEVTVGGHTATHLADGCANPYLASWSRPYRIEVEAAA
jgi:hypothetical protein